MCTRSGRARRRDGKKRLEAAVLLAECVREADALGGLVVVSMKVRSGWKPLLWIAWGCAKRMRLAVVYCAARRISHLCEIAGRKRAYRQAERRR